MRIVREFAREVRVIENTWIPMRDGTRLAARIWLPADAEREPVPAILEYLPYRKRDFTRAGDEPMHHYFAGHGYAAVRVDLRGTGDSDGLIRDEYTREEHEDALEVLSWLAAQPWCTGAVGMIGISWGGFNALQVAALAPPELKAIIAVCASDDRYTDDAHYMGGCLLADNLHWGAIFFHGNAYPPDPEIVGERWRAMWRARLEQIVLAPALWLEHQRRDDYWRQGSVRDDLARIRCAVYAVGGWADGYSNAVPRLLAGLACPRKGLIGPWGHAFPYDGVPGPAIGFLQEATRWWDQWLKGVDTGVMAEPLYRVWMQESVEPRPFYPSRPGRWVAESEWPSPRIEALDFAFAPGRLIAPRESAHDESAALELRSPETTGLNGGEWCGFGIEGEMPVDQREDDGKSLAFDSAPLAEPLEILGAPEVMLDLALDRPQGLVAVRLNDVAPDGAATRVSYGLLNLAHRDCHEHPRPLEPDRRYRVRARLNDIAHAFPIGNRLRVAISTCYWPLVWPAPERARLSLFPAGASLRLPVRPPRAEDAELPGFEEPAIAPPLEQAGLQRARFKRSVERDLASGEAVYTYFSEGSGGDGAAAVRLEPIGLDVGYAILRCLRILEQDPLAARAEVEQRTSFRRGEWRVAVESRVRLAATRTHFELEAELEAYEGERQVFARHWSRSIDRDHV